MVCAYIFMVFMAFGNGWTPAVTQDLSKGLPQLGKDQKISSLKIKWGTICDFFTPINIHVPHTALCDLYVEA
jgi:hypothetical protein